MNKPVMLLTLCMLGLGTLGGCGGPQKPVLTDEQARQQVAQLVTLRNEARAKFVLQLQKLQQAEDCRRTTLLRETATTMVEESELVPGDTQDLTVVHMELAEAEKKCLAK